MSLTTEVEAKHEKVRTFLHAHHLDGVLLSKHHNFAWFTAGGSNFVNTAAEVGTAHLLITVDRRILISNNIEGARLREELEARDEFEFEQHAWHDPRGQSEILRAHAAGKRLACDGGIPGMSPLPSDFDLLRHTLLDGELSLIHI